MLLKIEKTELINLKTKIMEITFEKLQEAKNKLIELFGSKHVEKMTLNDFINFYKTKKHF